MGIVVNVPVRTLAVLLRVRLLEKLFQARASRRPIRNNSSKQVIDRTEKVRKNYIFTVYIKLG